MQRNSAALAHGLLFIKMGKRCAHGAALSNNKNNEVKIQSRESIGAMLHDLTMIAARPSAFATPTRRQLLGTTAFVALTASLLLTTTMSRFAVAAATFDDAQKMMLLRVARDIYPHETLLDNAPYQAVVDAILTEADKDEKVAKMMSDGSSAPISISAPTPSTNPSMSM